MASGDRLTVGGFLGRFAFALLVMSATYDTGPVVAKSDVGVAPTAK